jgi:hypothetical protein
VTTDLAPGPAPATSCPQDALARHLQARTNGRWLCWYGHHTHRFWAMPTPTGLPILIEGETAADLTRAIAEVDAYYGGPSIPTPHAAPSTSVTGTRPPRSNEA